MTESWAQGTVPVVKQHVTRTNSVMSSDSFNGKQTFLNENIDVCSRDDGDDSDGSKVKSESPQATPVVIEEKEFLSQPRLPTPPTVCSEKVFFNYFT